MALSADRATSERGLDYRVAADKAKANQTIYSGSLVNRLTSDGYCQPGSDATGTTFAGVARNHITADGGSTHPKLILAQAGDFLLKFTATMTQAQLGIALYVSDDETVAAVGTTTYDVPCGVAVPPFVDATHVWVRIDGYAK